LCKCVIWEYYKFRIAAAEPQSQNRFSAGRFTPDSVMSSLMKLFPTLIASAVLLLHVHAASPTALAARRQNILFIAVDDLRPEFAAYGATQIKSPNLDRLASQGLRFDRAYCMVSTCGASRASLFTSVRPTPTRFADHLARADVDAPWAVAFHAQLKSHGYYTLSLGKILHHADDSADGWSETPWREKTPAYRLPENARLMRSSGHGPPTEMADVADEDYADGELAARAIQALQQRADEPAQPFLLAVGFHKPHLPFVAPKRYWDLYPPASIHLPDNYRVPENAPEEAIHNWGELRQYSGVPPKGPLTEEAAKNLIRGYYACVSYVDAQIGKVLAELDRLGLADSTIVVLWGDHGWNLGDHTLWCKHCTFESSMRIPLIIRAPGFKGGQHTNALTESIDLYPTLCELAGLPVPATVEGKSLVPLLSQPQSPWKDAAVGRFRSGDTIRTDRYRYSEYHDDKGNYQARMLYDHTTDPLENHNIAEVSAMTAIAAELSARLHATQRATANQTPPASRH
jgi:iduronate 2-sulfatase